MADSTIVAAKLEYTQQLCDKLTPLIYQGFQSIWVKCNTEKKALKSFQEKLCSIPIWNQDIIDNEHKRIIDNPDCQYLDQLIEAVFLSNVKVLSTIRIGKVKTINITIPETKNFIHKCYVESARYLWQDPYLIDDRENNLSYNEIKRNIKRSHLAITESIEKTIGKLIPIQNILESYLNEIDLEQDDNKEDHIENDNNTQVRKDSGFNEDINEDINDDTNDDTNDDINNNIDKNDNAHIDPLDHFMTEEPDINDSNDINVSNDSLDFINNKNEPDLEVTTGKNINDAESDAWDTLAVPENYKGKGEGQEHYIEKTRYNNIPSHIGIESNNGNNEDNYRGKSIKIPSTNSIIHSSNDKEDDPFFSDSDEE